jgi:hypothetical protein
VSRSVCMRRQPAMPGAREEGTSPEEVVVGIYRRMFFTFGGLSSFLALCSYFLST